MARGFGRGGDVTIQPRLPDQATASGAVIPAQVGIQGTIKPLRDARVREHDRRRCWLIARALPHMLRLRQEALARDRQRRLVLDRRRARSTLISSNRRLVLDMYQIFLDKRHTRKHAVRAAILSCSRHRHHPGRGEFDCQSQTFGNPRRLGITGIMVTVHWPQTMWRPCPDGRISGVFARNKQ